MKLLIKKQAQFTQRIIHKKFSILQEMTESIALNRINNINDIHPSKLVDPSELKKKTYKFSQIQSKKEYLFDKGHNPDEYLDLNIVLEGTQPALYSKLINNIIEKPYYLFNYGEQLQKHPLIFKEILFKSTLPTILATNNPTQILISFKQNLLKILMK